jgi:hypothetical protein
MVFFVCRGLDSSRCGKGSKATDGCDGCGGAAVEERCGGAGCERAYVWHLDAYRSVEKGWWWSLMLGGWVGGAVCVVRRSSSEVVDG